METSQEQSEVRAVARSLEGDSPDVLSGLRNLEIRFGDFLFR